MITAGNHCTSHLLSTHLNLLHLPLLRYPAKYGHSAPSFWPQHGACTCNHLQPLGLGNQLSSCILQGYKLDRHRSICSLHICLYCLKDSVLHAHAHGVHAHTLTDCISQGEEVDERELHFLIAHFLRTGPYTRAAEAFENEALELGLFPPRTDILGKHASNKGLACSPSADILGMYAYDYKHAHCASLPLPGCVNFTQMISL